MLTPAKTVHFVPSIASSSCHPKDLGAPFGSVRDKAGFERARRGYEAHRLAALGTGLALAYSCKGWGAGGDALAPPGFAVEQTVGGAPGSERLYSGASVP